jgi:hypothetical protein
MIVTRRTQVLRTAWWDSRCLPSCCPRRNVIPCRQPARFPAYDCGGPRFGINEAVDRKDFQLGQSPRLGVVGFFNRANDECEWSKGSATGDWKLGKGEPAVTIRTDPGPCAAFLATCNTWPRSASAAFEVRATLQSTAKSLYNYPCSHLEARGSNTAMEPWLYSCPVWHGVFHGFATKSRSTRESVCLKG